MTRNREARCPHCGAFYVYGRDCPPWNCEHVGFSWTVADKWQMKVFDRAAQPPAPESVALPWEHLSTQAIQVLGEERDALRARVAELERKGNAVLEHFNCLTKNHDCEAAETAWNEFVDAMEEKPNGEETT